MTDAPRPCCRSYILALQDACVGSAVVVHALEPCAIPQIQVTRKQEEALPARS